MSARGLEPARLLLTGGGRVRLNGCAILDVTVRHARSRGHAVTPLRTRSVPPCIHPHSPAFSLTLSLPHSVAPCLARCLARAPAQRPDQRGAAESERDDVASLGRLLVALACRSPAAASAAAIPSSLERLRETYSAQFSQLVASARAGAAGGVAAASRRGGRGVTVSRLCDG
jgi:hypothetical protein